MPPMACMIPDKAIGGMIHPLDDGYMTYRRMLSLKDTNRMNQLQEEDKITRGGMLSCQDGGDKMDTPSQGH